MGNCKTCIEENAVEIQREITNGIQGRILDKIPRLILSLRGISERITDRFPSESLIELLIQSPQVSIRIARVIGTVRFYSRVLIFYRKLQCFIGFS